MSLALVANSFFNMLRRSLDSVATQLCNALFLVVFLTIWITYTVKICTVLAQGLHILMVHKEKVSKGLCRRQTLWAARVLRMELVICFILGITTFFSWSCVLGVRIFQLSSPDGYQAYKSHIWLYVGCIRRFDLVGNAFGLAMLSGILWQGTPPEMEAEERRLQERAASRLSTIRMTQYLQEDLLADYQEKTKELAGRGVRLRNILDFWEKLLEREIMPSFDPAQSKTNDVVRQAIIPMTRQGHSGVSMATYWNDEEVSPLTMVTHNWSNKFGHLIAAILADAIGRTTYASIAEEITSRRGFETVRTQLNEEQLDDATYWICAFSVNQHASICGGFGREPNRELHPDKWSAWYSSKFDSVSKKEFTVCECEQKKIFSHKDPHCELNKFDDMMNYLQQKDRRFGQLVVVDEAFEVLNRAWCIAEIMEGNSLHEESKSCSQFQMRVNVFSRNSVDLHYDNLAVLDVTKCDATSEEDKQFILSKVSGREEAFNLKLQDLIFGCQGLFNPWIDVKERTRRVGLIWRRCAASTLTGEAAREAFSQRRPTLRTMWSNLRDEDGSSLDSDGSDV